MGHTFELSYQVLDVGGRAELAVRVPSEVKVTVGGTGIDLSQIPPINIR